MSVRDAATLGVADVSPDQFGVQKRLHVWPPMSMPALRSGRLEHAGNDSVTRGHSRLTAE